MLVGVLKLLNRKPKRLNIFVGVSMKLFVKRRPWLVIVALSWAVTSCSSKIEADDASTPKHASVSTQSLDVYSSPTCGCCTKWVSHVEAAHFDVALHHPSDLNKVKDDNGILPRYQSCHTAVTKDGYVFEGHIPADTMKRFLSNPPPNSLGLAVPGMPIGSPGMEMGNRYDAYNVLLLGKDGSSAVFEQIANDKQLVSDEI